MQDKIKINGIEIYQPDEDMGMNFEKTYTSDSTRTQDGVGHFTQMFAVEKFTYKVTDIPADEAKKILKEIMKPYFTLHYYSLFYGSWRDDTFYVGQGQCSIGTLSENKETLSSLSFNMVGVNPL